MNARCDPPPCAGAAIERVLTALRNPLCYPHPVRRIKILETHISWVVLTGDYAYKIKKPVNLGFLDFSAPAARRHYCEEELRLNRRLAPTIYIEVVAICGDPDTPRIGGGGPALEYAVKMREFPQSALADAALARGEFGESEIAALARRIAAFHAAAPVAAATPGSDAAALVLTPALDNFRQMLPLLEAASDIATLDRLRTWTVNEHQRIAPLLRPRLAGSRVRECHGDLHLGNIALIGGDPLPFDCIEFNAALRWVDVISEAAFVTMDLEAHGRRDLAHVFLNAYLEHSGDYAGIAVLPFYLAYRATVRAKIGLIRAAQQALTAQQRVDAIQSWRRYLALATAYTSPRHGAIIITHGLSGSGKTTLTQPAIGGLGAIRVRADAERKRLFGLDALARSGAPESAGIYTACATARTYETLAQYAGNIAGAGFPALVDATFVARSRRDTCRALAHDLGVPFAIVSVTAPPAVLRARIAARTARGTDASEATPAVLESQFAAAEPLGADELSRTVTIDNSGDTGASEIDICGPLTRALQEVLP